MLLFFVFLPLFLLLQRFCLPQFNSASGVQYWMIKKEEPHKHIHICNEYSTSTERNADSQCTVCVPECGRFVMSAVCSQAANLRFPRYARKRITFNSDVKLKGQLRQNFLRRPTVLRGLHWHSRWTPTVNQLATWLALKTSRQVATYCRPYKFTMTS